VYEECVCDELEARGIRFARQQTVPIRYKGKLLGMTYRLDLLVDDSLIVNLNVPILREGIRRLVHSKKNDSSDLCGSAPLR
jgi:GxxExxY protein